MDASREAASGIEQVRIRVNVLMREAIEEHQRGDLTLAQTRYREILQSDPANADAWHLLGVIARQQGRPQEAIECIQRAIAINDQAAPFFCNLGNALLDAGLLLEAVSAQRQALALRPDFPDAHCNLGVALTALGQYEAAEVAYQATLQYDSGHALTLTNLGSLMLKCNRAAEGLEPLRRVLARHPDHYEAHNNLALILQKLRRYDEAERVCKDAMAVSPTRAEAFNNLAGIRKEIGDIAGALELYRAAIERNPTLPQPVTNYGSILMEIGAVADAITTQTQFIEKAAATTPIENIATSMDCGQKFLEMVVNLLIGHWLLGQLKAGFMARIQFQPFNRTPVLKERKNAATFWVYLQSLYLHLHENTDDYVPATGCQLPILHVFGESHALAPANVRFDWLGEERVARAHFVMGTQMWHLARPEASYRRQVIRQQLEQLPADANVLMTIGEIDCRPAEGIWKTHRAKGISLDVLIAQTVEGYLGWLESIWMASPNRSLTIQGVPAPGYDLLEPFASSEDRTGFLKMIRAVNQALASGAHQRGWMFLDVYAATGNQEGRSHGKWHLDHYHLKPSFYREAWRWLR